MAGEPMVGHPRAMSNWKNIRLELARTDRFPAGSVSRGYLIRLPLNDSDLIDTAAFDLHPHRAIVRRFWSSQPDETGLLASANDDWAMRSDGLPPRILKLDGRPLRLGQQVSVLEADGSLLPFKVASVR
jgi:hypothetical protein